MSENLSVASVVIDRGLNRPLDYLIPSHLVGKIQPGMRVKVPLRGTACEGTVFSLKKKSNIEKLKQVLEVIGQDSYLDEELKQLALWMSKYYCCSIYQVYKLLIPSFLKKNVQPKTYVHLALNKSKKSVLEFISSCKSSKQIEILSYLLKKNGIFQSQLVDDLNISTGPIDSLIKKGILKKELLTLEEPTDYFRSRPKLLNTEQQACLDTILQTESFRVHLIHGITGSGKTEIYLQAIDAVLKKGKSALVLLPEVALTAQMLERFRARFEEDIAILHHKKSSSERLKAFEQIKKEKIKIVIGARSAVFAPVKNLGLIVVDEEHEACFKQSQEPPFYHARDVAIVRAQICNCPIVLGSATPSVESFYNAKKSKYELSALTQRAASAKLPSIQIVNMKQEFKQNGGFTHFSQPLLDKIKKRYEQGEQTLLFLNKRGYYTSYLCSSCEHVLKCPHCDLSLTYHKSSHRLTCHLCDFVAPLSKNCPKCNLPMLKYKGFGTEHVEKSLQALFPHIRTLRMDKDTTQKKHDHETYLKRFRSGKADVLIGTQMIAKGFHFPSVTLVGILQADSALYIPDFRASETTFQLLMQVSGRAGRSNLAGEVVIQTFNPDHPILKKVKQQDYLSFYEQEIEQRVAFGYSPENHLWKITFIGKEEQKTEKLANQFSAELQNIAPNGYHFHPICPCAYAKIKDHFRFQLLIRGKKVYPLNKCLFQIKQRYLKEHIHIDVDPVSIFS